MRQFAWLVTLAGILVLAGCGGGGGAAPPAVSGGGTGGNTGNDGATIGSIANTLTAVSSTKVNLEGSTPPADVDIGEANSLQSGGLTSAVTTEAAGMSNIKLHMLKGNAAATAAAASFRRTKGSAVNSPWDVSYFGGFALSGAQSNDIFVSVPPNNNCDASCRKANNVHPGTMLHDLYHDQFIDLVQQYLSSPGELVVPGGRFALGQSVNVSYTPGASPPGFTNPVMQQSDILNVLVEGINAVGNTGPNLVHIYNIVLPSGVDTCFTGNTQCWSPDNPSTFVFCAYHAAAQDSSGNIYLFTVIPWVSLNFCSASATGINFPNQVSQGNDPADAIYGVLSHETFETITDPVPGTGWVNYANGDEIGDECPGFQNFVNLNSDPYYIQSEYSDVGHECISANLTPGNHQQTP